MWDGPQLVRYPGSVDDLEPAATHLSRRSLSLQARQVTSGRIRPGTASYRDYLAVQPDGPFALQIQRQLRDWELVVSTIPTKQETAAAPTVAVTQD